eukprot:c6122_g1_i1.p1 GENE.c6122_g1_i1~~c6122_g1_i1.p1  ORF type:complete len:457 (+),score=121.26 c6122_g1_i1:170-1540(+)
MLLRVRGPDSQDRFNVEPTTSLHDVKQMISTKSGIPIERIQLFFDNGTGKPTSDVVSGTTIAQSNLSHGSMIHYTDLGVVRVNGIEESKKVFAMDVEKLAKEREARRVEDEKIRNSLYTKREGWGANTVTFKKSNKLKMIKEQKERVAVQAQITSASAKILVKEFVDSGYHTHRCAFIFGTLKRRKQEVSVFCWDGVTQRDEMIRTTKMRMETMWMPPQVGDMEGVVILDDEESRKKIEKAETIAAYLGLSCVGLMMTVPIQQAREGKARLRARDILLASQWQAKYGPGFTTIIVPVGQDERGSTWSSCEAWQCTESCTQLYKQGDLESQQTNDDMLQLKDYVVVYREQADRGVKETEAVSVEVEMFQKKIPIQSHRTRFMGPSVFQGETKDIAVYLKFFKYKPWPKRIADFNLLYQLFDLLGSELQVLCAEIQTGNVSEGHKLLITSFAGVDDLD